MKAALSILLTALLIILPVEQVLGQAAQQQSTTPEASLVQEQGPQQPVIQEGE